MKVAANKLAGYKAQAALLKALAHPTRLLIIDELSGGERCVCEITALVGHEMPTVSRHLSLLKFAGVIEDEKRGAQVFYRLKRRCVMDFFRCVASVQAGEDCDIPRIQPTFAPSSVPTANRNGKVRL